MFSSCVSPPYKFPPMKPGKDEQVAWVRAILAHLGITATELARRAKLAPSTLQRPLAEPDSPAMLSGRTLEAISQVAGFRPFEFPARPRGFGESEAEPFQPDPAAAQLLRAVKELCAGRNGRDPWVMKGYTLELQGILPGDIMIVDLNQHPRPGDVVCAQVYDWSRSRADTLMRVYNPPYLMANGIREGLHKPILIDGQDVVVKGVVDAVLRPRAAA